MNDPSLQLLYAGLKTITIESVDMAAEARGGKPTLHYLVMGCDACATARDICSDPYQDPADAAAFIIHRVYSSGERIKLHVANDIHVHQDNRIHAYMPAHDGIYLWTVSAFLKTLTPEAAAHHWLSSPKLDKHQLLLVGSPWQIALDVQAYAVKYTSASGCGQVALMTRRVTRYTPDALQAIEIV